MQSYSDNVHHPINETIPFLGKNDIPLRTALKSIYTNREYFKTLEFSHADISAWLMSAANDTLTGFGTTLEVNEELLHHFENKLKTMKKTDNEE